jgi:hypothetical protein
MVTGPAWALAVCDLAAELLTPYWRARQDVGLLDSVLG